MNERSMESVPDFRTPRSNVASDVRPLTFEGAPTTIDADAVERLRRTLIPEGTKGMPWRASDMTLAELGATGLATLDGAFPMPLMILRESALATNIAAMADYCLEHGVWLSPHGKTTMAPQLFQRQIDAGAWGLTAATPGHLRLYRQFGVQRILYANQLVEASAIDWLAHELRCDAGFEFCCLVDSVESVSLLDGGLSRKGVPRPVRVLVEIGYPGGRCGVRDDATAREVADAVDRAPWLELWGVECFEGLLSDANGLETIDRFLKMVRDVAVDLLAVSSLRERGEIVITAGGSAYFDRVIQTFVDDWNQPEPARVVLRSGCYITQDGGFYQRTSPLDGRGSAAVLRDGIEIWSAVLSRPEAGLAICSMGRRDAPLDMGMPTPIKACRVGERPLSLDAASVVALNDQHAHIAVDPGCELKPGDLVGCSISHPCTAFDRWRVIPVVDDQYAVCDAVATFF
jgi:D-serine dehydratase